MTGVNNPWSIKEREFNVMRETIISNNLTRGFEVATAFGISTLALGLGFKETNGLLVTMDAFIEENREHSGAYIEEYNVTFQDSKGFKSVSDLITHFGLGSTVLPTVGWSPIDTLTNIGKGFNAAETPLDFAFIDAGHWDSALIADVSAIKGVMSPDKFVVFIHDLHCFSDTALKVVEESLGGIVHRVASCAIPTGFNLAYVAKGVQVWGE
jgi:predicted O-methyltransferase YrrM